MARLCCVDGVLTSTLSPGYKVYDVSNINKTKNKEVDPTTFAMSPGDTLYIVQGLDITAEGDNLAAELKGGLKAMEGVMPLTPRSLTGVALI